MILWLLSRFKEALPLLREAESFSFDNKENEQEVHVALGACLADANHTEAAKRAFLRVIRCGYKNAIEEQALFHLASLHYRIGALAQAKEQLETILRDFPVESCAIPRKEVYAFLSKTFHYLDDKVNEAFYADLAKRAG